MKVLIPVAFEVECVDPEDHADLVERVAKDAAELTAFHHLTLIENSGYNTDTEEVEVHVDGFGKCKVKLAEQD